MKTTLLLVGNKINIALAAILLYLTIYTILNGHVLLALMDCAIAYWNLKGSLLSYINAE